MLTVPNMRRIARGALGLLVGLAVGCVNTAESPAHKEGADKPAVAPPTAPEPPFRPLALPAANADGPDREVVVVLDVAHLKIVTITLRRGTLLPEHTAPVPVIIQAASGAGTAVLGDQRVRLDGTHAVTLAPNVPHAVEPDPGTDMTLLVFHLRGGGGGPSS